MRMLVVCILCFFLAGCNSNKQKSYIRHSVRDVTIPMEAIVHFSPQQWSIQKHEAQKLALIAAIADKNNLKLKITGYSSAAKKEENEHISHLRAASVAKYLLNRGGNSLKIKINYHTYEESMNKKYEVENMKQEFRCAKIALYYEEHEHEHNLPNVPGVGEESANHSARGEEEWATIFDEILVGGGKGEG